MAEDMNNWVGDVGGARRELARRSMLGYVRYMMPEYEVNWHHELMCRYLDKFVSGEIKKLIVTIPPQHGKELAYDTPVLTFNRGWVSHGELVVGDIVFGRNGEPVKVLALSEDCMSEYDVLFTDGTTIQCHGNHEWVVFNRYSMKWETMETKTMANIVLNTGVKSRGNRNMLQVDANVCVDFDNVDLPLHPYLLGAWLGDGTAGSNVITHHPDDVAHVDYISSLGYKLISSKPHRDTGIIRTSFDGFTMKLKEMGVWKSKRIPKQYLLSSREQRLELLAGLIDTDGYVYHKNGRVTFSNINKDLIDDVKDLVISLGCRVSVVSFPPKLSTSGIQGKHVVYQLAFNPNFHIPCKLERKKTKNINPAVRKRGIVSIVKAQEPKMGRCIQVEGGIYLVGKTMIPTHNSELTSRMLPSYIFGKNPNAKIILSSYNADKAEEFNREIQRYLDKPEYALLFPHVQLQKSGSQGAYVRNTKRFDITGYRGFLKSVGVGGGITGTPCDVAIIDDPIKGREEANSLTTLEGIWGWYNSELLTRLHNDSKQLVIMTRWDSDDLVGRLLESMNESGVRDWEIVNLPAIKENDDNPDDPRKVGEALWESRHGLKKLLDAKRLDHRTFQSLMQQNPMPVQVGGEAYKDFDANMTVLDRLDYNPNLPLHVSFDFNVNPYMPCGIYQVESYTKVKANGDIDKYYNVNMIEEITLKTPKNTTRHVCNYIRTKYSEHVSGMFIYGDPHGMDEDTRSEKGKNDYTIIMAELARFNPKLRVAKKADNVRVRIGFMNAIFNGSVNNIVFRIDRRCVKSIEDLQYIKEDSDGGKFKQMFVDPSTGVKCQRFGHCSDFMEYFFTICFQREFIKYQKGGLNPTNMMLGSLKKNNNFRSRNMY